MRKWITNELKARNEKKAGRFVIDNPPQHQKYCQEKRRPCVSKCRCTSLLLFSVLVLKSIYDWFASNCASYFLQCEFQYPLEGLKTNWPWQGQRLGGLTIDFQWEIEIGKDMERGYEFWQNTIVRKCPVLGHGSSRQFSVRCQIDLFIAPVSWKLPVVALCRLIFFCRRYCHILP